MLFGDGRVDEDMQYGGRVNVGFWYDACQDNAVEFSFMAVDNDGTHYTAASLGDPILARPFYNVILNEQDAQLTAYSDVIEGGIAIGTTSELYSASALLRRTLRCSAGEKIDVVGGYRYLRFCEGLSIYEDLVSTDPMGDVQIGTEIDVYDAFTAENDFHGGEIGFSAEFFRGPFSLAILTKLGIGYVRQQVTIDGWTTVTVPDGSPVTQDGGLLALSTNTGTHTTDRFALLPELDVTLNCQLTCNLRLSLGYNLLWLTEVARSGDQIDFGVNPTYLPGSRVSPTGARRPAPLLNTTSMWAQAVSVGAVLEF
jgi:hypothetical protein